MKRWQIIMKRGWCKKKEKIRTKDGSGENDRKVPEKTHKLQDFIVKTGLAAEDRIQGIQSAPRISPTFSGLPIELRLMIWEFVATTDQQTIRLSQTPLLHEFTDARPMLVPPSPCMYIQPALVVNHESRQVALKYYILLPTNSFFLSARVNFDRDTLYIEQYQTDKIMRMAVSTVLSTRPIWRQFQKVAWEVSLKKEYELTNASDCLDTMLPYTIVYTPQPVYQYHKDLNNKECGSTQGIIDLQSLDWLLEWGGLWKIWLHLRVHKSWHGLIEKCFKDYFDQQRVERAEKRRDSSRAQQ
ncbi:unnamed protein product [Diplocarpon coronariae]|nr:hypothetical protein JHW43_007426 [Diplocarpon mali]